MPRFFADALPLLIGSLPMDDHDAATRLVFEHTPQIPLWVQLPGYPQEGMIEQFMDGLPGLVKTPEKSYLDTAGPDFENQVLAFYEDYLAVTESGKELAGSRFELPDDKRRGFDAFLRQLERCKPMPHAVKGQVTGPVTFGTRMTDQTDTAVFYNDSLRDMAIKKLAMNARWQARTFSSKGAVPIIFIDEPVLAGLGTSAYITISSQAVTQSIEEVADAVHQEQGLAGVHVCANTEWNLLLESNIDIISFDACHYFDRFILYPDQILAFLEKGGILAWGIVPTMSAGEIRDATVDSLLEEFNVQLQQVSALGISRETILRQSFITPSCGTGPLSFELAKRVLSLTRDLSMVIREDA